MEHRDIIKDKMLGCLYGQAVGNALGLVTEFMDKAAVQSQYPDMLRRYPGDNGVWEDDDTNQMLCVLDELVEHHGLNPRSLAARLNHWLETDGRGCGNLVYQVIRHREFLDDPFKAAYDRWLLSQRNAAPNGALMRTSVIGLMPDGVERLAVDACKVTHADPRCIGSCVTVCTLIHELVWHGYALRPEELRHIAEKYDTRIDEWIDLALKPDISVLKLDDHGGIGYTLRTLAAALWAYFHAPDFESGLVTIVNEGGDADTNAAVACAVLGAKYGYSRIPEYYITHLIHADAYRTRVDALLRRVLG